MRVKENADDYRYFPDPDLPPVIISESKIDSIIKDLPFLPFEFENRWIDEYDFKKIVILLKQNGITTIGADNQLTERNIMKLVDILKEQESPEDNLNLEEGQLIIDKLKLMLDSWQRKQYNNDKEKWEMFTLDLVELIEDYEEEMSMKGITMDSPLNENLKKRIRTEIKKLMQE